MFEQEPEEGLTPIPQEVFPDVYTSYSLMAEGRFEVAGVRADPANARRESLPAGQRIEFKWKVSAAEKGSYTGNMWLTLRFLPLDGGEAVERPIFVHEVKIKAISLLGLGGAMARLLGGVGIIIGMALNYDVMIKLAGRVVNRLDPQLNKDAKEINRQG